MARPEIDAESDFGQSSPVADCGDQKDPPTEENQNNVTREKKTIHIYGDNMTVNLYL